ncbi:cobalamin-binding protein [Ideonella sp. DXS29W]|uniref:Cobalamin-binding protein n=1 Tax=Ideonella lacteola TaxID=2984193 RepID=A0ABU9BUR9_9BURK
MRRLGLSLALLWCHAVHGQAVSVVDDSGHTIRLDKPPQRVIALGPHLTEQLFAIGAGPQVVGVSRYSDYPAAAQALPIVGDAVAVQHEAIAKLKPDLVLVWRTGFPERARAPLQALGIPVYESEIRSVAGLAQSLRSLGRLMGRSEAGNEQARRVESQWAQLQAEYARRSPVRVFYQLWHQPLMTINREHLIHQAITACGGTNLFAELPSLTPTVSWETAVQRNPQVIAMAGAPSDRPELAQWPRFADVDAVKHQRFAMIDGDLIGRMGPRFVQGARQLCEAIDKARP